jgi:transcription antitermination factor NusA-like protein
VIGREAPGAFPHLLSVRWVQDRSTALSYIKQGKCIVRMSYRSDPTRNLINATLSYLEKSLISEARPYMEATVRKAIEYTVARKVLETDRTANALARFLEEDYEPTVEKNPAVSDYCQVMEQADTAGLFTRVLLSELYIFGLRARGELPSDALKTEAKEFSCDYLREVSNKVLGNIEEDIELRFIKNKIKTNIMLFIKSTTERAHGLEAHRRRITILLRQGIESLYLLGLGGKDRRNIGAARAVAARAEREGKLKLLRDQTFQYVNARGQTVQAVCIAAETIPTYMPDPQEAVWAACEYEVPEIGEGRVKIERVAREPGVMTKVVVRSMFHYIDALGCCIGEHGSRLEAIRKRLDKDLIERVHIIEWTEDPKVLLARAVFPHHPEDVLRVVVEGGNRAIVYVANGELAAKAVGASGYNIRLAAEVAGFERAVVRTVGSGTEERNNTT